MAGKKGPGRRAGDSGSGWRAAVMARFDDLTPAGRRDALEAAVRRQEVLVADALACELRDLSRRRIRVLEEMREELARLCRAGEGPPATEPTTAADTWVMG